MFKLLLIFFIISSSLYAKRVYNIAIITDGATKFRGDYEGQLKKEIVSLLNRDYNVRFPKSMRVDGQWKYFAIAEGINKAMKNPKVNLILTIGALSSHLATRKSRYRKPVIATTVIDPKMQHIPYKNGTSGKYNLTYTSGYLSLSSDIYNMKKLLKGKNVAVLMNYAMLKYTPDVGKYLKKAFEMAELNASLVPIRANEIDDDLSKIPEGVDYVYTTPLFQLDTQERIKLYDDLRIKQLPSFAAVGRDDVDLGALFGTIPNTDNKRLIRQISLSIQQIALGVEPSSLPVDFKTNAELSLNMQTAYDVDYTPGWDLLSRANVINESDDNSHFFSLEEIMNRAIEYNLYVISSKHEILASKKSVESSDGQLYPQLSLGFDAAQIDDDRAKASFGALPKSKLEVNLKVKQLVYDQSVSKTVKIDETIQESKNSKLAYIRQDVSLQVAMIYLNIMQLKTKLVIQKSNLELSKSSLRSAQTKKNIGIGSNSDIYRWQSKIANDKKELLFTYAAIEKSKFSLNSLLDLPMDLNINLQDIEPEDRIFMTSKSEIRDYFRDPNGFKKFEKFIVADAAKHSPNLREYSEIVKARKIATEMTKTAMYAPNIYFKGGIAQDLLYLDLDETAQAALKQNGIKRPDATSYSFGIYANMPLYTGGTLTSEYEKSAEELLASKTLETKLKNDIELRTRNSLYQAKASYLSTRLAHESYLAAKKNLNLINTVYAQGNIDIINLLDAQNQTLNAALVENTNKYGFMRDMLKLQREIGKVNFSMKRKAFKEWFKDIEEL